MSYTAAATSLSSSCIRIDNTILPGRHHAVVVNPSSSKISIWALSNHTTKISSSFPPLSSSCSWVLRSSRQLCRARRGEQWKSSKVILIIIRVLTTCLSSLLVNTAMCPVTDFKTKTALWAVLIVIDLILKKLSRYGLSGILSYGLLNTAYYLSAFLVAWFYIAPAPCKMGYFTAVKRFVKLMAMVWAGSQVTKLLRAGGALALAPVVDKGLSWFMSKFKFKSQAKAFTVIVGCCFGLAAVMFIVMTLLSA